MVFIYSLIFALSKTKKNMIQHNQVGKYKTKQSIIDAKIGSVFITPCNYEYELLRKEKVGKRWHYVYNWVNCPDEIKEKINNTRFIATVELNVMQIDMCINEKIKVSKES